MPKNISATIPQRVSLLYPLNKVVVILTKKQEENYNEFWNRSSFIRMSPLVSLRLL